MGPGEFKKLHWIFTKAGTHQISGHLFGWVDKLDEQAGEAWKPISQNTIETSEVRTYVFQVGDTLAAVEPPMFDVVLSVYSLEGEGAEVFTISPISDKTTAQIVVAHGADLDYETTSSYTNTGSWYISSIPAGSSVRGIVLPGLSTYDASRLIPHPTYKCLTGGMSGDSRYLRFVLRLYPQSNPLSIKPTTSPNRDT